MRNFIKLELAIFLFGIILMTLSQEIPTSGYCEHIANIYNNLNSKYLGITRSIK
jgi:hypothetical protein